MIKLRVANIREMRNMNGKPLGSPNRRWEDNTYEMVVNKYGKSSTCGLDSSSDGDGLSGCMISELISWPDEMKDSMLSGINCKVRIR